jgi:putative MATE family efflux protein
MTERSDRDDVLIDADISCCGGPAVDELAWNRGKRSGSDALSCVGVIDTAGEPTEKSDSIAGGILSGADLDEMMSHPSAMRRAILALAWPVVTELVLQTVTQMADMIMVGRLGAECVAAVGLSNQPFRIIQGFFMGIGVGTTALVARFTGAGDRRRANRVTAQSLAVGSILAALFALLGYIFTPQLVGFMKAGPDVVPYAESYMRVLMPGLFMLVINMVTSSALRGAGDTRYPMRVNIILNLANILGNYILIYGNFGAPALGVTGAALATTIARTIGTAMLLFHVLSGKGRIAVRTVGERFRFDPDLIRRIFNVGLPASLERVSLSLGISFYVRIVSALGTAAYAAHAIAINAEGISYMPGFAFAVAATTMVGQALGADRPDVAERAGVESWKMSATVMGLMGAVLFIFPEALMRLYGDDLEIIRMGAEVLQIMALAQIPMATSYVFVGALRGAGDTRAVLIFTMACVWGVRFCLAWLFVNVFGWGLPGAWYAMAIDWVARGTVSALRFRGGRWKQMRI